MCRSGPIWSGSWSAGGEQVTNTQLELDRIRFELRSVCKSGRPEIDRLAGWLSGAGAGDGALVALQQNSWCRGKTNLVGSNISHNLASGASRLAWRESMSFGFEFEFKFKTETRAVGYLSTSSSFTLFQWLGKLALIKADFGQTEQLSLLSLSSSSVMRRPERLLCVSRP